MEGFGYKRESFADLRGSKIEDITLFRDLLSKSRDTLGKTAVEIARELSISENTVLGWEGGRETPLFPNGKRIKFPDIARAYGIEFEEFMRVLNISKRAHEKLKESRRPSVKKRKI